MICVVIWFDQQKCDKALANPIIHNRPPARTHPIRLTMKNASWSFDIVESRTLFFVRASELCMLLYHTNEKELWRGRKRNFPRAGKRNSHENYAWKKDFLSILNFNTPFMSLLIFLSPFAPSIMKFFPPLFLFPSANNNCVKMDNLKLLMLKHVQAEATTTARRIQSSYRRRISRRIFPQKYLRFLSQRECS